MTNLEDLVVLQQNVEVRDACQQANPIEAHEPCGEADVSSLESDESTLVNVASIPKRSPFRYPGGKTWLVPRIREWLRSLDQIPTLFCEPFAGGGIISLTIVFEQLAEHVTMVELDEQVAAVWQTILSDDAMWLANRVKSFDITPENVDEVLANQSPTVAEKAFQTILKNRVNRGGILAQGAGKLKSGEKGKGIGSRWYPDTLYKRIMDIRSKRDRITFVHGDGLDIMQQYAQQHDAVFFIDPPYTATTKNAGARLYTHSDLDHEHLFRVTETLAGDFLMTYDDAEEIQMLAQQHNFDVTTVAMKNTHHAKMTELLIGRDLNWIQPLPSS